MAQPLNVLVLGVGGNVSQGILKALAISKLSCRVIGACIEPRSFGLYTVDQAYVSPLATDPSFIDWLIRVCREERVQAILSGVEPVLAVMSRETDRIRAECGAIALVSAPECLAIGDDKLLTCRWLEQHGFAFPRYADAQDPCAVRSLVEECGYPLIAKPRRGKGAGGLLELRNEAELNAATARDGYVIQAYLGDPSQEYTAGCFSDREGRVRGVIVLHRELLDGTTSRAEAGEFPAARDEAVRIIEALRPMGSSNVQMRMHHDCAVCFEINVRFSGTTPIRARLGFNDVEAALRHYVLGEPARDLPPVTRGIALRYWNEAYPDCDAVAELDRRSILSGPHAAIEDYGMSR